MGDIERPEWRSPCAACAAVAEDIGPTSVWSPVKMSPLVIFVFTLTTSRARARVEQGGAENAAAVKSAGRTVVTAPALLNKCTWAPKFTASTKWVDGRSIADGRIRHAVVERGIAGVGIGGAQRQPRRAVLTRGYWRRWTGETVLKSPGICVGSIGAGLPPRRRPQSEIGR